MLPPAPDFGAPLPLQPSPEALRFLALRRSTSALTLAEPGPDAGQLKFAWQRDWFDLGSTATTFLAIAASGKAPQGLLDRMAVDGKAQPGHYPYAGLPSTLWPPPVERGDFVTQSSAGESAP